MHIYTDYAERLLTEIHFLEIIRFYILVEFKSLLLFWVFTLSNELTDIHMKQSRLSRTVSKLSLVIDL